MRDFFFIVLCCALVFVAGCVLSVRPEMSPFGYRLQVAGEREIAHASAERQAVSFCESEGKRYQFGRLVDRSRYRMGLYYSAYDLYFTCEGEQEPKIAKPDKGKPKKREAPVRKEAKPRQQEPASKKASVSSGSKVTEQPSKNTAKSRGISLSAGKKASPASPAEIQPAALPKEENKPTLHTAAAVIVPVRDAPAKKKKYVPGDFERLAPPGEEEPGILDGNVIEETLAE